MMTNYIFMIPTLDSHVLKKAKDHYSNTFNNYNYNLRMNVNSVVHGKVAKFNLRGKKCGKLTFRLDFERVAHDQDCIIVVHILFH
jgi:hypothetical protein